MSIDDRRMDRPITTGFVLGGVAVVLQIAPIVIRLSI